MFTAACSIAGRMVAATGACGSFGMRLPGLSCLMVSAMPPPKTVPASSQSLGSGGAGGPMTSRTVTTAPVKVPATGIIEPLAVTWASGLPSTETSATASPWTRTATSLPSVTPAQAHAGRPPRSAAARVPASTRAAPSPFAQATAVSAVSSGSGPASVPPVSATR